MTNSGEPFVPLLVRHGIDEREFTALSISVEPHLVKPLWRWCLPHITHEPLHDVLRKQGLGWEAAAEAAHELRHDYEEGLNPQGRRMCLALRLPVDSDAELATAIESRPDTLLDIIDWLLRSGTLDDEADATAQQLEQMLLDGGSAWAVAPDLNGLVQRVSAAETADVHMAMSSDDQAAAHIAAAWNAAWRREPSPSDAYSAAVKALESVLAPIVTPNDPRPTLGKMIAAMRDKPEKWATRFRGVETVGALTEIVDEVWRAQYRHGGGQGDPNTLDEARDAVSLAVTLTAMCRRGFLRSLADGSRA